MCIPLKVFTILLFLPCIKYHCLYLIFQAALHHSVTIGYILFCNLVKIK